MYRYFIIFILMLLVGCTDAVIPASEPQLVIEGWIENGAAPIVMVTTSVPVSTEYRDLKDLEKHVVRWATVSVFDGEKEIYLTGKTNKDYFPPYIYTTSMMSGEVGKTYSLKVVYGGKTAEAETVIPKLAELEYIHAQEAEGDDYVLLAGFRDNPDTKDYYKFFAKVSSKDSVFKSSFLGLVDDDILTDEVNEVQVMNGYNPSSLSQDPNVYFQRGDRVLVRFSTLGESEYNYWKDFDDVSYLSLNPFFPVTKKIRSNVRGGSGYWAGYGSSHYVVTIPD